MVGIVYQGKDTIIKMKTKLFTALFLAGYFVVSVQAQNQRATSRQPQIQGPAQ